MEFIVGTMNKHKNFCLNKSKALGKRLIILFFYYSAEWTWYLNDP